MADEEQVQGAEFPDMSGAGAVAGGTANLDLIKDIKVDLSVELGRTDMMIQEILELTSGKVIELNKLAGEPLDILINGQVLARGEVVVVDDHFGVRVTSIMDPRSRVKAMGEASEQAAEQVSAGDDA